jgi:rare lipoprotein A
MAAYDAVGWFEDFFDDLFGGGGGSSLPPNYFVYKARVERARRHPQYPKIDHIPNGIVLSQDSSARVKFGKASYYNLPGKTTSSGEPFNANEMTAAMRDVPLGTRVTVKYLPSGSNIYRAVNVTVNDHGPYVGGRIIDLTPAAFAALTNGHLDLGVVPVGVIIPAEPEPPLTEER